MKAIVKIVLVYVNIVLLLCVFPLIYLERLTDRFFSLRIPRKFDIGIGPEPLINNVHWSNALKLEQYKVETFVVGCYYITSDFDVNYGQGLKKLLLYFPTILFLRHWLRYRVLFIYFNGGILSVNALSHRHLRRLEPFIMRKSSLKTVVMPYGSDSQNLIHTPNKIMVDALCKDYPNVFKYNVFKVQKNVERWTKSANRVIGAMDSIDYMAYWDIALPCHFAVSVPTLLKESEKLQTDVFNILHTSNHKHIKGTYVIDQTIRRLIDEGYKINYVYLSGVDNQTVKQAIAEADLIIDQLIMGWYGMFALECMAQAKPVITFIRSDLKHFYESIGALELDEIPLISSNTLDLYPTLKKILDGKYDLEKIGQSSYEFAQKHNAYEVIAQSFKPMIDTLLKGNDKHDK